jgi:hypothetical protein
LANQSWLIRQIGQKVRLKNTGVEPKLGASVVMPVEIVRPVFGHLIIRVPTAASLNVPVFLSVVAHYLWRARSRQAQFGRRPKVPLPIEQMFGYPGPERTPAL